MERRSVRQNFPKEIREDVRYQQEGRCADCGGHHPLQTHHVLPSSEYGSIDRRNAVGLCPRCHQRHDREALCNNRLFYEVLMEEGREYDVRKLARLAGLSMATVRSPDRLRGALRRPDAPYYPQIQTGQITTFADEAKSGRLEYYPFVDALAPLLGEN